MDKEEFQRKLNCLFEYFNAFRFYAEQRRNMLRLINSGKTEQKMNPSLDAELQEMEELTKETNELFPYMKPLDEFKKLLEDQYDRTN